MLTPRSSAPSPCLCPAWSASSCRSCRLLLDLLMRQGLRCLTVSDAKLQLEYFGLLSVHLPRPGAVLSKLVLKDVMGAGSESRGAGVRHGGRE